MHPTTKNVFLLAALGSLAAPISPSFGPRGLLTISPTIDPKLDLSGNNNCLGVGVSVCDPINVNSSHTAGQNDNDNDNANQVQYGNDCRPHADGNDGSLITISPNLSPEVDASHNNDCVGVGISACDPINVNNGHEM